MCSTLGSGSTEAFCILGKLLNELSLPTSPSAIPHTKIVNTIEHAEINKKSISFSEPLLRKNR
jgi:hypothetical protein